MINNRFYKFSLILACLVFSSFNHSKPTICKNWYSEKENVCLTIQEKGYSTINAYDKVKIKVKGNKLKIATYYNRIALSGGKEISWLNIDRLTQDTLVLSLIEGKECIETMMPIDDNIVFVSCLNGCTKKW